MGTRHRIGGEPDGVTEEHYPRCRWCEEAVAQGEQRAGVKRHD